MIPAMMMARGGGTAYYANSVNMLTAPYGSGDLSTYRVWTVPAGVTSVDIFAHGKGGQLDSIGATTGYPSFNTIVACGACGGAGGIDFVRHTVTPGDVLAYQAPSGVFTLYKVTNASGPVLSTIAWCGSGADSVGFADGLFPATNGGGAWYSPNGGTTVYQASGGAGNSSGDGGNGGYAAVPAGGFVYGGGGGGGGRTLAPSLVAGYLGGAAGHPSYARGVNTTTVSQYGVTLPFGAPGNSRSPGGRVSYTLQGNPVKLLPPDNVTFTLYY